MRARPSSVGVSSQYYNNKEFFAGAQVKVTTITQCTFMCSFIYVLPDEKDNCGKIGNDATIQ